MIYVRVPDDLLNGCSVSNDEFIAASQAYDITVGDYTGSELYTAATRLFDADIDEQSMKI